MTKRILCFLSALLLSLLPALTLADCTHADENGVPYGLVPRGYVAPQVGVPGYSGDQCCASCGAVLIRGSEIPALLPPPAAEEPVPQEEPKQVEPAPQEPPKQEEPPVEQPVIPAAEPQAPAAPPAQPESPVVPASQPVSQPEKPAETRVETPVQPPETQPEKQPEARTETAPAQLPAPPPEEKPTQSKPAESNEPAKTPARTPGGGKTTKPERERFSMMYPYRRVRMYPQPDILAEFAGELLWPVAGTPFLNMFGE